MLPRVPLLLLFIFGLTTATSGLRAAAPPSPSERGRPLVRAFGRLEHKAHALFQSPFESPEGLMYFGNQLAVMEYDGRTWRILKIPLPFVRAMARGEGGEIYVGSEDQFGVVARPDTGDARFLSLLDHIPAAAKPFGLVRDIVAWRGNIYAATDRNLLRYRPADRSVHVWPLAGDFRNRLAAAGNRLVLHRAGEGLFEVTGDTLRPWSRATELRHAGSAFVAPLDAAGDELLVGLDSRGLFRVDAQGAVTPWPTEADAILRRTQVLTGRRLRDGALAIGTEAEGVVIVTPDGRLGRQLTRETGLPHPTVFALAEDREQGLWVCTNSGPARVDWRSAATVFDHQRGGITDAAAADFTRHDGTFFYLSADGLYRLVPSPDPRQPATFARDPRVDVQLKLASLLSHPGGLLLAGARGLQRLTTGGLELLSAVPDGLRSLAASKRQPARIYFATHTGVGTGVFAPDGTWRDEGPIAGITGECEDTVETPDGTLWVSTVSRGIYRATRAPGAADWRNADVRLFTTADGLPADHGMIFLWETGLGLHFDTASGLFRFDPATNRFAFDAALTAWTTRPLVLNPVTGGAPGELWTNGLGTDYKTKEVPYPLLRLQRQPDGSVRPAAMPPEIHELFAGSGARRIFWERGANGRDVVWAKGELYLVRIEVDQLVPRTVSVPPLIRDIQAEGHGLIFPVAGPGALALKFSPEPITLSFVSGRFRQPEFERFQTRLLGFNNAWTAPTRRTEATFTNLERGPFIFEVRSVDPQGQPGPATQVTLTVAPPWQRTNLAYTLYSLAALGGIAGFVRWRLGAGERERARLERQIAQRTEELRHAKDAADEANRAKSVFLANMSHELRTPLNGVIGYAQVLMKDRELSPKNRERLQIVQSSGEHLLRMINEVLDFSKIEAGRMELATTPFHLPQLLRDVAAAISARVEQKELEFAFEPAPDLPDLVLGDPLKLRQVIDNLLGNAVKFTARGTIRFHTQVLADEAVRFSVSDTGVGIGESDRARLFQPFQQAVDGRPPEPGTGLGLAISQRLVELMGGKLEVDSEPGVGSTFHFSIRLPVLATDAAEERKSAAVITGYRGRRRRILVVDDVATNRHVLRELLAPLGFEITEAATGAEALAIAPQVQPDLLLLDLRMPGIDGFELARRLRARAGGDQLKLIAMSASVLSFRREDAFAAGCDDFLPKPFREDDLLARLGMALQLEWVGDNGAVRPGSRPPFEALAPPLPPAVLDDLLAIARRGEIAQLRRRLADLRGDPLVETLEALARSYRMERIRELLEERVARTRLPPHAP